MDKIRKNDEVIVLAGKDKGKRGVVSRRVDAEHVIGAGAEAELAHGMAQVDHLAGLIGMRVAEFLARDVDLVEDRGDDAVPFQRALRGEAVLDAHVELCARDAARREHRGGLALFGG